MTPINLQDYAALAEAQLDAHAWDFIQGGSDDEVTLRANESEYSRLRLLELLRTEYQLALALLGCPHSSALDRSYIAAVAAQGGVARSPF